jgi:hypothetical protein
MARYRSGRSPDTETVRQHDIDRNGFETIDDVSMMMLVVAGIRPVGNLGPDDPVEGR